MRELTHADLEQFNALLRYAFQVTSDELTRSGWQEDEFNHAKAPILDGAYVLGWFHKDRLASQIVVYPMQVNIEGVLYDMGGVTGVTTYPEYSGRGLIHTLVVKILEIMRERGQSISYLYPYSIPFYRKRGGKSYPTNSRSASRIPSFQSTAPCPAWWSAWIRSTKT